jgi:hypothetical protein
MSKTETSGKKSSVKSTKSKSTKSKSSDSKSAESKSSDSKSSDSKSAESKSAESKSAGTGSSEGKAAKDSVGGAANVHYGYFSSVRTKAYRSGWDNIWSKKSNKR